LRGGTTRSPRTKWPDAPTFGSDELHRGTASSAADEVGILPSKPYFMEESEMEVGSGAWQSPRGGGLGEEEVTPRRRAGSIRCANVELTSPRFSLEKQ
jgi:hypothetical protein